MKLWDKRLFGSSILGTIVIIFMALSNVPIWYYQLIVGLMLATIITMSVSWTILDKAKIEQFLTGERNGKKQ